MAISPVSTTQPVYPTDFASTGDKQDRRTGATGTTPQETAAARTEVSISAAGKNKAQEQKQYPLEYYSLPAWLNDPFAIQLPDKLEIVLDPRESFPARLPDKIDRLSGSDKSYFLKARMEHWSQFMAENNFADLEEYYQKMIADKASSEEYRIKWEAQIAKDPRYMSILEKGRQMA